MLEHGGAFFSFEGLDGSGKTTQLELLARHLEATGHRVVKAQEPGGTRVGLEIRKILLDAASSDLRAIPELLLYFASRAQNVDEVIFPALEAGHIVLADRFTDATIAYQGFGRGLGAEPVETLDRIACRGLKPDLTFWIDIDVQTSIARARKRNSAAPSNEDRMEQEGLGFHEKVREGYVEIGQREPRRVIPVAGERTVEEIAAEIRTLAEGFLVTRNLLRIAD